MQLKKIGGNVKQRPFIGQLISIKYKDRKTPVYGYVIDYNEDWTLMKYNPVDYIVDGYIVLRHKNIKGYRRDIEEKWKEKVINLKGVKLSKKDIIPITDLETILKYLTNKFEVFQVYTKSETACYLGRLKSINNKELIMYNLNPKGKWEGTLKFKTGDIRVIAYNNDYISSLKLVSTIKKRKP